MAVVLFYDELLLFLVRSLEDVKSQHFRQVRARVDSDSTGLVTPGIRLLDPGSGNELCKLTGSPNR